MNDGSAIPDWLAQVLPKWFTTRPAFTEAAYAFALSLFHSTGVILAGCYGFATAQGHADSISDFIAYALANWQGPTLMFVFGGGVAYQRGVTAHAKAKDAAEVNTP